MEEYQFKRNHVPAFGSWDWNDNLPFTQCFESATQAGFLSYTYSQTNQDQDLYVTPAMIVVPRTREKVRSQHEKDVKKQNWVSNVVKEPQSPTPISRPTPKPVDEDLYKISPELLYAKTTKKRGFCFFPSCFCIA
ncbi:uncharacterized protein [Cicer arietinum]|uniref:Uncharacterized protein LOC101506574 n=1 Tax=Cicer arietinum TaxID=3827 RepID=A0A1S2YUN6_CICAR|nr:uncharacterized protein LOC101506574 [Cicer arietinum]